MMQLILILEDTDNKYRYEFGSSVELENLLLSIALNKYSYKNILIYVDDELNFGMSKIYKKRYLIDC
jgi:hypothetical protein